MIHNGLVSGVKNKHNRLFGLHFCPIVNNFFRYRGRELNYLTKTCIENACRLRFLPFNLNGELDKYDVGYI